jgi:hypothetical protein
MTVPVSRRRRRLQRQVEIVHACERERLVG